MYGVFYGVMFQQSSYICSTLSSTSYTVQTIDFLYYYYVCYVYLWQVPQNNSTYLKRHRKNTIHKISTNKDKLRGRAKTIRADKQSHVDGQVRIRKKEKKKKFSGFVHFKKGRGIDVNKRTATMQFCNFL